MQSDVSDRKHTLAYARSPLVVGYLALALLLGVIGVWSITVQISGAVMAAGILQVEGRRQVIQHAEGGVVSEILVRDGAEVKAGEVVLRLDDRDLRSEWAVVSAQLNELRARKGRLSAERDGRDRIEFTPEMMALAIRDAEAAALLDGQTRLFETRLSALAQQAEQIDTQIAQVRAQIKGGEAQRKAVFDQTKLIGSEIEDAQTLFEKGLMQSSRLSELRRERARLIGVTGQKIADIAKLKGDIAQLKIEKLRLYSQRREDAISALRDLQVQEAQLIERSMTLAAKIDKMQLRAPASGVIFGNTVFARHSVITPAAPIMYVVPQDQTLVVSARVEAVHIDQIYVGQIARLRFTAFDQRSTPEILGVVSRVSADVITDERTGATYYQLHVAPETSELVKLGGQGLLPGMPVDAFIQTRARTPLSYLVQPLTDHFTRAFRET